MARVNGQLRIEIGDDAMLRRSLESIGETLAFATREGEEITELVWADGGCTFRGQLVFRFGPPACRGWTITISVQPDVGMPLLANEILTCVPGATVAWEDGWPIFTPPKPFDEADDPAPAPVGGSLLEWAV
jgi:hypothetical protein